MEFFSCFACGATNTGQEEENAGQLPANLIHSNLPDRFAEEPILGQLPKFEKESVCKNTSAVIGESESLSPSEIPPFFEQGSSSHHTSQGERPAFGSAKVPLLGSQQPAQEEIVLLEQSEQSITPESANPFCSELLNISDKSKSIEELVTQTMQLIKSKVYLKADNKTYWPNVPAKKEKYYSPEALKNRYLKHQAVVENKLTIDKNSALTCGPQSSLACKYIRDYLWQH